VNGINEASVGRRQYLLRQPSAGQRPPVFQEDVFVDFEPMLVRAWHGPSGHDELTDRLPPGGLELERVELITSRDYVLHRE
jgi:hypothetical protein